MTECCKSVEGFVTVSRMFKKGKLELEDDRKTEKIKLPLMKDTPTATVSADRFVSKNLGNFNNIRVGAFVSVPCYLEESEIQGAMDFCVKFCEDRIEKDSKEFMDFLLAKYPDIFKKVP